MNTWLITGCSSGLGRALAQVVLKNGLNAVVTARSAAAVEDIAAEYPETALALSLDVTKREQIDEAIRRAGERFGGVDVLVNNAGHGYRAAVEEADDRDLDELFATNFFGPVALIKAVLPEMRLRRRGCIVNISSIAAQDAMPGSGYYSATKSALEAVSKALRKEVGPLQIRVIVVEPGAFRTDFSGRSLQQSRTPIADYASTAGLRRKENDSTDGTQPGDPTRGAQAILDVVVNPSTPRRLLLGSDAVRFVRSTLTAELEDINQWEQTSISTDFPT